MENKMENKNAVAITSVTLVGYHIKEYPAENGNCFSMRCDDNTEYRIVNFNAENMKELLKHGLTYPIEILPMSEHIAVIDDGRIGERWYSKKYCTVCCPYNLLPIPQQFKKKREEKFGIVTVIKGDKFDIEKVNLDKYKEQF